MLLKEETARVMRDLAESTLNGEILELPGTSPHRLAVYRDLVFNAFDDTLLQAFPLASRALGERWAEMVHAFVSSGPKTSPVLWRMPKEFVDFVESEKYADRFASPWLDEMLSFEWMEISVYMMEDREIPSRDASLSEHPQGAIVLNPHFEIAGYEHPVFRTIRPEELNGKGQYLLLAFRHIDTNKVLFHEISPALVVVLELLARTPQSLSSAMASIEQTQGIRLNEEEVFCGLKDLESAGMVLGVCL